jgi:hypothetical protein
MLGVHTTRRLFQKGATGLVVRVEQRSSAKARSGRGSRRVCLAALSCGIALRRDTSYSGVMRGMIALGVLGCSTAVTTAALAQRDLGEAVETGCPVDVAEYGTIIRRLFTASDGTQMSFTLDIPADFNPGVRHGVSLYFHGNDDDSDGTFYPDLFRVPANSRSYGLVQGAVLSPTGREFAEDGVYARDWRTKDGWYLEELFASDFGGCLPLDHQKVVLSGESDGTCFISGVLTSFLWRDYAGGILGYCGCWPPQVEYLYPVDAEKLRNNFRVFIQNTTGGFEYWNGPNGYEHLHYNLGMEVRTDLLRSGDHCVDSRVNGEAALDWIMGAAEYEPEFDFVPYWEQLELSPNYIDNWIATDGKGRTVLIRYEPHLTDEDRELIGAKVRQAENDLSEFYEWRNQNFPEFEQLMPRVFFSDDAGDTWSGGDPLSTQLVWDLLLGSDGYAYIATVNGLLRDDGTGANFTTVAFEGERVDAVEQDENGTLYVYGVVLPNVRRSKDGGVTWEELPMAPTPNGVLLRERDMLLYSEGVLTIVQGDDTVLYSQDHGDTWQQATLPFSPVGFTHLGTTFYAVSSYMDELSVSTDAGATWQALELPDGYVYPEMKLSPTGDLFVQGSATSYRYTDQGTAYQREPGLNLLRDMDIAFGPDGSAIAVGLRGIFRHQTEASSLPDTSGLDADDTLPGDSSSGEATDSSNSATSPTTGASTVSAATAGVATTTSPATGATDGLPGGSETSGVPVSTADAPGDASADAATTNEGCGCRVGGRQARDDRWWLWGAVALTLSRRRIRAKTSQPVRHE